MLNPDLVKFLRDLSKSDKKNLTEKLGKTTEELGELARAVLPYVSAYATTHRFVDRMQILEEVADGIICNASMAFDLDFTWSEIEDMIAHKAKKWAMLQAKEKAAKWPVPFEIHLTVRDAKLDDFRSACTLLGVKPLLLDLQDKDGQTVFHDLMTSQVHLGNNTTAYAEMRRVSERLRAVGFNVVREKIETAPWHPGAPSREAGVSTMPKNCYFECHIGIIVEEERQPALRELVENLGMHLSRNVFKRVDEKRVKIMATYRRYDGVVEDFQANVAQIEGALAGHKFETDKTIVEFSIYDTKVSHDASWIQGAVAVKP